MKIITYNFKHYLEPEWQTRLAQMVESFDKYDADILALQNVRGKVDVPLDNMVQHIYEKLKEKDKEYPWVIIKPVMKHEDNTWEGLALFSRIEFIDSGVHLLPLGEGEDKTLRSVLYGRYPLGNELFYIFNNHFSYDENQALFNAEKSHASTIGCPEKSLFLGDFNSNPDSKAITYLKEQGWVDLWTEIHSDDMGFNYPANSPCLRRNYIFRSPDFDYEIKDLKIVFDENNNKNSLYPSDHLGLLIDIEKTEQ